MKAPLSWLKEFVDIDENIQTICDKMVAIGLEIEEVNYLGKNVTGTVVGQIKETFPHPNADRLLCCKVDVGSELIPIVTNDKKLKAGDKVPVALDKAVLANGLKISKGKMRGEDSCGMFCGAEELGINKDMYSGADCDGVLILDAKAEIGSDIRKEIGIDDYVLDVSVTSNRQDCNSIYGLAREISVALGKKLKTLACDFSEGAANTESLVDVEVTAKDICPNYEMQALTSVRVASSPVWMTSRLSKVGLHGINNIVDITNYVLYEVGQPMHAFDCGNVQDGKIVVRRARDGEQIIPLDNKVYKLSGDDLVIADAVKATGIAGIMGGAGSGISGLTSTVLFESASFARGSVRRTSRRLNLRSDSSARFEKGIDVYTNGLGLSRALHLAELIGCGVPSKGRITIGNAFERKKITFPQTEIKRLLGIDIPADKIISILTSLNIETKIENGTVCTYVPPYRDDITRDCDIIEELIRVYGYNNISGTLMTCSRITAGGFSQEETSVTAIKNKLVGANYNECVSYPFGGKSLFEKASLFAVDESQYIRVINPIGEELSLMNRSLAPNMLMCVSLNLSRKNTDLRLFETGKAYIADSLPVSKLPREEKLLSLAATNLSFDDFKNDVLTVLRAFSDNLIFVRSQNTLLHPGVAADVLINGACVGYFGKIHPEIAAKFDIGEACMFAELNIGMILSQARGEIKYSPIAKFPAVERDFALVTDENIAAQDVLNVFKAVPTVESAKLFDVYRGPQVGEGKKSLALSVSFRDKNKTLSDADIEKLVSKCLAALKDKYGAVLR